VVFLVEDALRKVPFHHYWKIPLFLCGHANIEAIQSHPCFVHVEEAQGRLRRALPFVVHRPQILRAMPNLFETVGIVPIVMVAKPTREVLSAHVAPFRAAVAGYVRARKVL